MNVNLCTFYTEFSVTSLNKMIMVCLFIVDFGFLMVLRLLTLLFHNHHKQRVDEIIKNKVIERDMIKVQEIGNTEHTGTNFHPEGGKELDVKNKKDKQEKRSDSSGSSESSNEENKESSQIKEKEKYAIEIKNLKINQHELLDIYSILLGHRLIAVSFAMMYFPFGLTTLFSLTQSLLLMTYFLCRFCGASCRFLLFPKGLVYFLNLVLLSIGLYGMVTSVPTVSGSCNNL